MNHDYVSTGDAATHAQIAAVPHQSDAYRALEAKIRKAAGWHEVADNNIRYGHWLHREPLPLKIRIKSTGAVVLTGYEHAREKVLAGVAELAE
jgi:hypothetical protein